MTPKYAIQTSKYWGFLMIDINSKVISSLEEKSRQIRLETAKICSQVVSLSTRTAYKINLL